MTSKRAAALPCTRFRSPVVIVSRRLGAPWLLGGKVDKDRFLLEVICVTKAARGQGIGTAITAVKEV